MAIELDPVEQRVIGSLLEKERTVPDTYPMTVNGLRTACNQTSGRDPILSLSEADVQSALDRLRPRGLTRVLHPSHGARQPKFRQVLDEVLTLTGGERAVLTLLLLRGAQTPGELRSRSDRLHAFTSLEEVDSALNGLLGRDDPLVLEQERRPGQKERRWIHRLGPVSDPADSEADPSSPNPTEAVLADGTDARDQRVRDAYSRVATAYADQLLDELDRKPFDRWLLERLAELSDGGPIADVGCGPGHVAAYLSLAGAHVTGFDLSEGMVDEARRRFPDLRFDVADLRTLPPPEEGSGWAVITAWYALVHLAASELTATIASLARSVHPDGWVAVALHEGSEVRRADDWFEPGTSLDFTFNTRDDVVAAFRSAGLTDIEWYLRNSSSPSEAATNRLYVLGRRPT